MMETMNHLLERATYGVGMFAMVIVSYAHITPLTIQGMRRVVATGRYDDAQFDF